MMIRKIVGIFVLATSLLAYEPSEEESLALRRIADFWQEGEIQIAKSQMEEFIGAFPDSPYFDTLTMALGDLLLREKSYQLALSYYAKIKTQETLDKAFLNRMQCLYHLQWYATLADECEAHLKKNDDIQATYLLAIALYQQCLNLDKDPDALRTAALRAKPHFEKLAKSELSDEVAGAYAHLCCILKDYESAAKAYLELAVRSDAPEEMRFQAALLQAKYDKGLSTATFDELAKLGGARAKDAAYNRLVLAFEQERFDEIVAGKETWLAASTPERAGLIHQLVGKSLLALKRYKEAAAELGAFLDSPASKDAERPALLHLVEAAYRAQDLGLLERAITRLASDDAARPQALLQRFELLKTTGHLEEARAQIETLLGNTADFPERAHASLERIALAASTKDWENCHRWAAEFLAERPKDALAPYAWRYLAAASAETKNSERLTRDLDALLTAGDFLTADERGRWEFVRAKIDFEAGRLEESANRLAKLLASDAAFSERANAELLLAMGSKQDLLTFSTLAERALQSGATLLPANEQRLALFNAYLGLQKLPQAAEHLLNAFFDGAELQAPNLMWLSDFLYDTHAPRAVEFLNALLDKKLTDEPEEIKLKIAKLHKLEGRAQAAIELLETVVTSAAAPTESFLVLGELHASAGHTERARALFGALINKNSAKRDRFTVAATLQAIRLGAATDRESAAVGLKNLVLQKTLENEPLHLEAALDYVELQGGQDPQKRVALLEKMRIDFTEQTDLLSKDYHAARAKLEAQDRIYQAYMQYLEADLLLAKGEKELQAKAKDLLLQIKEPLLKERVEKRLKDVP